MLNGPPDEPEDNVSMGLDPSLATKLAEPAAAFAWKHRRTLISVGGELIQMVKSGRSRVLVFGMGGTGKSTLGKFLAGELNDEELLKPYQDSFAVEPYGLPGTQFGRLLVAPGQTPREHSWDELRAMLLNGAISGVINVVSYGYHGFQERRAWHTDPVFQAGMTVEDFMVAWLAHRRSQEVAQIEKLADDLSRAPNKLWILTFVAKQDLWWDRRAEVRAFYGTGSYNDVVTRIQGVKGAHHCPHELVEGALTWRNLEDGVGAVLAKTVAGYDYPERQAALARFSLGLKQLLGGAP